MKGQSVADVACSTCGFTDCNGNHCPYCGERAANFHEEIAHMNAVHPDVICQRLVEAGLEPPDR